MQSNSFAACHTRTIAPSPTPTLSAHTHSIADGHSSRHTPLQSPAAHRAARRLARMALACGARRVAVSHWIAAQWFERNRATLNPADHERVPVQVALLTPDASNATHGRGVTRAYAGSRRPTRRESPREHVLTALQPATQAAPPAAAASDVTASAPAAAAKPNPTPMPARAPPARPAHRCRERAASRARREIFVPPSAELQYDTFYNGVRNQPGTIHWDSDGQGYA